MPNKQKIDVNTIKDELQNMKGYGLKFKNAHLESSYIGDSVAEYILTDKWVMAFGLFMYFGFIIFDFTYFKAFSNVLVPARIIFCTLSGIVVYLTFFNPVSYLARRSISVAAFLQIMACAFICMDALMIGYAYCYAYLAGLAPALVGVIASLRSNFKEALVSIVFVWGTLLVTLLILFYKFPPGTVAYSKVTYEYYVPGFLSFLFFMGFLGLFVPYLVERTLRVDWLKTQIISYESEELKLLNHQFKNLSNIDDLTSIANRRKFIKRLDEEYQYAGKSGESISLIMIDVDYFKNYNDTYGHGAGDECLRRVAQAMIKQCNRASDLAARYGGEEFMLLMPNTSKQDALHICDKLNLSINQLGIEHKSSPLKNLTISIGLVSFRYNPEVGVNYMIKRVDEALYEAKEKGRNCTVYKDIYTD